MTAKASRDDISLETVSDFRNGINVTKIKVKVGNNEYSTTYTDAKARETAIKMLIELMLKREVGVTEHDVVMKTYEYEMELQ